MWSYLCSTNTHHYLFPAKKIIVNLWAECTSTISKYFGVGCLKAHTKFFIYYFYYKPFLCMYNVHCTLAEKGAWTKKLIAFNLWWWWLRELVYSFFFYKCVFVFCLLIFLTLSFLCLFRSLYSLSIFKILVLLAIHPDPLHLAGSGSNSGNVDPYPGSKKNNRDKLTKKSTKL